METADRGANHALTAEHLELVRRARQTIEAHTDAGLGQDGLHTVGAAVRASDGRIFVGVNLFHFTGGPWTELVALGAARANGASEVTHIVAVGDDGRGVMAPCGRDRQILVDHFPGIRVIVPTPEGLSAVPGRGTAARAFHPLPAS